MTDIWKDKKISSAATDEIKIIPLLDNNGRLKKIALSETDGFQIGGHHITENSPSFVIAAVAFFFL